MRRCRNITVIMATEVLVMVVQEVLVQKELHRNRKVLR
jgi:hypothetical protein